MTYTQFECKSDTAKVEENWQDQANLTYSTSRERSFSQGDDVLSAITGGNRGSSGQQNFDDQKGIDMLKDAMKDKSLLELFDNGIKALMLRQQILNSI